MHGTSMARSLVLLLSLSALGRLLLFFLQEQRSSGAGVLAALQPLLLADAKEEEEPLPGRDRAGRCGWDGRRRAGCT